MFGENASFIKTVEIDDSIFQCNPECAEKYLLQLKSEKEKSLETAPKGLLREKRHPLSSWETTMPLWLAVK